MRWPSKASNQSGDTIVEVLIAVVVVASVLAGAFTVSQKSSLAVRQSQERGEMLQLLQGQVELVRGIALNAADYSDPIFETAPSGAEYFCIDEATRTRKNFNSTLPALNTDEFLPSVYHDACRNIKGRYNVAIKYNDSTRIFTFHGRWHGLGGKKSQEILSYRIYPGTTP